MTLRSLRTSVCVGVVALVLGSAETGFGQGPRHFREGLEAYQRSDFDAAIRSFTLAIESGDLPHPDIFFALNNRGNAYAAKHDSARALRDYDEALRLNPKYAGAMRNRGLVYAETGDYDQAIRDFSEAARLDPDDPHALIGRGLVLCVRREFGDAVRDFDAALRLCPSCSRAIAGRAAAASGKECR